jgi:major vault protein
LEKGIQQVYVLGDEEALLLRAREEYVEGAERHAPGDRWMVKGPTDYIPPIQVEVLETRKKIPLDRNEGIYVRDIRTGAVRSVMNQSYLLNPYEELWQKDLPQLVEDLLVRENAAGQDAGKRDRSRVVTFRAAHNTAVQVYDYKNKSSRVVFGPEIVTLEPDEDFTVLDLSGGKPKQPHLIKSLALQLGPEFSTDIITVETSDHARLSITLSYNWYFDLPEDAEARQAHGRRLFQVPDFIGDFCKAIAARVRGAVAAVSFDQFHKNSARLIRVAVFGEDENKKVRNRFVFTANQLVITNIDIQSVEPVDQRTRDALQKSVQLAIEITTKSQEATARHEAERLEQEAKGRLERQKLIDESKAEELRKKLIELQANSACVETSGVAIAEARGRAEAARIEGESNVALAQLRADAGSIREAMELELQKSRNELELKYARDLNEAELHKARELSKIESQKFNDIVAAIGPKTIALFVQAGSEL